MIASVNNLNEWSLLHNMSIRVLNKPKRVFFHKTGFEMTNEDRGGLR
jgi:hypothetical protein